MKSLVAALAVMILLLLGVRPPLLFSAAAQHPDMSRVRVLAIAPFYDEVYVPDLVQQAPTRLNQLIGRASFRTVPSPEVASAMKRLGLVPWDLISPSRTIEVGRTVGADAVLTGRITYALHEHGGGRDVASMMMNGGSSSRVVVDIRVLEVNTRLKLLEDEFSCQVAGLLPAAMDCVMQEVASQLIPGP